MSVRIAVTVVLAIGLLGSHARAASVRAEKTSDSIRVYCGDRHFTDYRFNRSQKYPYFWPVKGPASGKSLTTETSDPYPHHHSLFFGCDKVNGWNFWQEANARGQIVSRGPAIVRQPKGKDFVEIEDVCDWRPPGQSPVMQDFRRMVVRAPSDSIRLVDFQIRLVPEVDVTIRKTNHALFSARVMPHLSVKSGGRLVNAEGLESEKGTFGKKSSWCDYSGKNGDAVEGIAIFDHPANRWYPCTWFTRDYGFFSPTPMNWLEGGELRLPQGKPLELRYRVVVHAGDAAQAGIADLFKGWSREH